MRLQCKNSPIMYIIVVQIVTLGQMLGTKEKFKVKCEKYIWNMIKNLFSESCDVTICEIAM